ncbi:MAG TPA: HIRAN domain-containing protein [Clostridiaceae bacterium]
MGFLNFLFKKDKNKLVGTAKVEQNVIKPIEDAQIITNPKEEITFKVEDIFDGIIQREIKAMVKEEKDIDNLYKGLSNEEILEKYSEKDKIYEVYMHGNHEIKLIPEPENKYDSTAIKVVHEEMGDVGYVPAIDCKKVKRALEEGYLIEWRLVGGKYKCVRHDSGNYKKVVKVYNHEYGIMMLLTKL